MRPNYSRVLRRLIASAIAHGVPRGILSDPEHFPLWEKRGIHILRASFYSPVPILMELKPRPHDGRATMPGVEINEAEQRELLNALVAFAENEKADLCQFIEYKQPSDSGSYAGADRIVYYSMLRHLRPRRVIEVGAGTSTLVAGYALHRNAGGNGRVPAQLTSIDPYAQPQGRVPGQWEMIQQPVQEIPASTFQQLESGDVLFIDSTHVCKVGSDVNYLLLEILPRLNPGVWVHFHDIFLPDDYPEQWIRKHRFWNEQYLLQAFLAFNSAYRVALATNHMAQCCGASYPCIFGDDCAGGEPGSFWIRRV